MRIPEDEKRDEKNMILAFGGNCSQTEISTDFSTN